MPTEITDPGIISPEMAADSDAVIARILSGKPLDPEDYRGVRERGQRVTDEIRRKHGLVNWAVDLVRQRRDEQ